MHTLMKHRLLLVAAIALALLLGWYVLVGGVLAQEEPPVRGCPEGKKCVRVRDWPPFTAIFKAYANHSISVDGVQYRPIVTYRLEWRRVNDWEYTIIDGERFDFDGLIFDLTGSYERFQNGTHTTYNAFHREERVEQKDDSFPSPPGGSTYRLTRYAGLDLATRTDGETVAVSADVCVADACHEVQAAASEATAAAMGRRFSDESIANHTFTDMLGRIPLKVDRSGPGMVEVLELRVHPTEPDPSACQINLRTVIVEANLDAQQWDSACASGHRSGSFSHYYTFTVGHDQDVTIEAVSPGDDLYLYLLEGADKTGTIIEENDDLSVAPSLASGSSQSHASGIERRLDAGTYTAEVTTNGSGWSSGSFSLAVHAPLPTPTPTPTPPPTPCGKGVAVPDPAGNPGLVSDCEILLDALDDLLGTQTDSLEWSAEKPVSSWSGVTVSGTPSRVTELTLAYRGLSGTVPSELIELDALRRLDLRGNQLTGSIPSAIGLLFNLEFIHLKGNSLSGSIPSSLGNLSRLHTLFLSNNGLSGAIPLELGYLTSLEKLTLYDNDLSGDIPSELGDLGKLSYVYLSGNELTGCVPASWANIEKKDDPPTLGLSYCQTPQ